MIVVRTAEAAEQALTEGQLVCPRRGCGDTLRRWRYGRRRHVRSLGSQVIDAREVNPSRRPGKLRQQRPPPPRSPGAGYGIAAPPAKPHIDAGALAAVSRSPRSTNSRGQVL